MALSSFDFLTPILLYPFLGWPHTPSDAPLWLTVLSNPWMSCTTRWYALYPNDRCNTNSGFFWSDLCPFHWLLKNYVHPFYSANNVLPLDLSFGSLLKAPRAFPLSITYRLQVACVSLFTSSISACSQVAS